ncbi:MAG: hypothetical protein ACAF41_11965 [Leptolyngbya sp. BL-A-14]
MGTISTPVSLLAFFQGEYLPDRWYRAFSSLGKLLSRTQAYDRLPWQSDRYRPPDSYENNWDELSSQEHKMGFFARPLKKV